MTRPIVTIHSISLNYARYFDWLIAGLGEMQDRGEIEYRCELQPLNRLMSINGPRWLLRRISPQIFDEISGGPILQGSITSGTKTATFCYDIDDRPFNFDLNVLIKVDLYFKAQMPIYFPDPFRLSNELTFDYPDSVLECQNRILPAMLGRPLARSLKPNANRTVLNRWRKYGNNEPSNSLFAYFGGVSPEQTRSMVMDMGKRGFHCSHLVFPADTAGASTLPHCKPFGHPNQKRLELVRLLRSWDDPKADARILSCSDKSLIGPPISNPIDYAAKLADYDWNCNITGLFGSIPFRFADSFSLGRGIVTDKLTVKWYQPFDPETEVRDLGPLGYELPENVDWQRVEQVLHKARSDTDHTSNKERRSHVKDRFETIWSPLAFSRYIVSSCLTTL